ncbi:MAG: hypothetical protein FJW79_05025 [Actinobacteria bacterium]|nr:hypothetical protein [Actinomycetota bacterium]
MKGAKEQEQRATSALLAVMQVVPSFGKAVLRFLDAPSGRISCFVEPRFLSDEGETVVPDGMVVVEKGKTRWVCLVEVKTGASALHAQQVERYLRIAGREGFHALLTVSNQIVPAPSESPVTVRRPLVRKVVLRHLSWFRILTEAVVEKEHRGVEDREQAKVLADLIAFMEDERSGASGYEGMGASWVGVREAANQGLLSPATQGVREVAENWQQFLQYLSLQLRQDLGRPVTQIFSKGSDPRSRLAADAKTLGTDGRLEGSLKVPNAIAPIVVEADLGKLRVTTRLKVPATREGRPKTRINWLLRQLPDAPGDLRVEVHYPHARQTPLAAIAEARINPEALLLPGDPKRAPLSFDLALTRPMGTKRGKSPGSFVAATANQVHEFYGSVVQHLRVQRPVHPPRLPKDPGKPIDHTAVTPDAREDAPEATPPPLP